MTGPFDQRLSRLELAVARQTPEDPSLTHYVHDDNVIRFCRHELGVDVYPRQATKLKLMTCAVELLTPYDDEVIEQWTAGYQPARDLDGLFYQGSSGTTPDVRARLQFCRDGGRDVFREIIDVGGRRSSKSAQAAIVTVHRISALLGHGDPQATLGLPRGKQITIVTVSATRENNQRDIFRDVARLVSSSARLRPWLEYKGMSELRFWTPSQVADGARHRGDQGCIVVTALPTTASSGRGPAVIGSIFDEFAFVDGRGSSSSADEIHRAITPAMAQFDSSFAILASSPTTKTGRFYEAYRAACELDPTTGEARLMDSLVLHGASWDTYLDWERAHTLPMWPNGPTFEPKTRPVIATTSREVVRTRERNFDEYLVEYRGQWGTAASSYLPTAMVDRVFQPFGEELVAALQQPDTPAALHIDMSLTHDNTALALARAVVVDGVTHYIVTHLQAWCPRDFPAGVVDYDLVANRAVELAVRFQAAMSIDSYQSLAMSDRISDRLPAGDSGLQRAVLAPKVVTTTAVNKLERWEWTKTLAAEGRLHVEPNRLARDELSFLQLIGTRIAAPESGPVTSDDLADAISHAVTRLKQFDGANIVRLGQLKIAVSESISQRFAALRPSKPMPYNPARGIRRQR